LRPTADRVRETLFNWLQPVIAGAHCLDLFAGSGALGFEAASRGAGRVVMIEQSDAVASVLAANVRDLGATQVEVRRGDALRWLATSGEPFDIVFIDPPFALELLTPSCSLLSSQGWLAGKALVYLEASARHAFPVLPAGWELVRDRRAGRVRFALACIGDWVGDFP
jgi:16S rRNA (guanine966-N2)-methyltransferase